jgi:hypothetical protein
MVQELLTLLPPPTHFALVLAIAGSLVGAGLWLTGARYSRGLITLAAVGVGCAVGMLVPAWLDRPVHPMACAVGAAMLAGACGYILHRLWVGIGLGLVLALWATLATWILVGGDERWDWPNATESLWAYAVVVWQQLPELVRLYLPFAAGVAMLSGICATLLWPRLGVVLLYSAGGVSLLLGMGLAAVEYGRPDWMRYLPGETWAQMLTLLGLVAFGAVLQWQQPAPSGAAAPPEANMNKDEP